MLSGVLKCSLAVFLTCAFLVGSDARATNNANSSGGSASASAYAGTVTSAGTNVSALSGANTFTNAFTRRGNFPAAHERHKGIRTYDNTNVPQDNDANRGIKSLGSRTKSGSQNYNKDDDGCSKCKWENDDYWERDEPEEEGNENDGDECDDGDDGQYRPDKTHHHGENRSREHALELHPPGVHKTGLIDIYGDNVKERVKGDKPDGFGVTNFPGSIGYAGLISSYGSTPRPGSIWNTPFAGTSKPEYSGVTVNTFVTTPSYGQETGWNKGTTSFGYESTPKSAGDGRHDDTFAGNFRTTPSSTWNIGFSGNPTVAGFPSSQKSGLSWNVGDNTPAGSYGSTPKPEPIWDIGIGAPTGRFPASQKSGISWTSGYDDIPIGGYGTTPRPGKGWNTRFPDIPTTGSPFLRKPTSDWNSDHGNIPAESFGIIPKPESSWNTESGALITGFPSSQKPVISWSTRRDGVPIESSVSTVNLGQNQNTGFDSKSGSNWSPNQGTMLVSTSGCTRLDTSCSQGNHGPVKVGATPFDSGLAKNEKSPSNISPATSHEGSGTSGAHAEAGITSNFESTPYGKIPIQSQASYGNSGAHAGAGVTFGFGSTPYNGVPDFGQKGHPFGFDKPTSTLTLYGNRRYDGLNQAHSKTGAYGDTFSPGKLLESPAEDSMHGYSGAFKPSYGTETTNIVSSSAGIGSSVWPASIPSIPTGSYSSYPGVKGSFGSTKPIYENGPLSTQPDGRIVTRPGKQSGSENAPWLSKQPESSIIPGDHPGSGVGIWSSRKPEDRSVTTLGKHPGSNSETWSGTKPGSEITASGHSVIETSPGHSADGSNVSLTQQLGDGSKIWPSGQVGRESRPRCSSGSCEGSTGPFSGSSSCERNYNCGGGCKGRSNNAPTIHEPCGRVISGPSGVNKTYYPAGTGDGNVPNIVNIYKPGSFSNIDNGAYSRVQCRKGDNLCNQGADVTPENPVQWNSANPFLYGPVDSILNYASRPLSRTTPKPIGKGNPFLDSSWNNSKAGDNYASNDRNVIRPGQENTKPFNKENPFLNNNKRKGDIEINTNEQVIPFGGRKLEGNNLFDASFGNGNSGSSGLSYNKHPTSASPGSGLPGSSNYGNVKSGLHSGRISPQGGDSNTPYFAGGDFQNTGSLQCKLGLFGCGTSGSGSYAATKGGKHPGEVHGGIDGNTGVGIGGLGSVNSGPGELGNSRTGIAPAFGSYGGRFGIGAGYSGSAGNNLAGFVGGAHAGAYVGSFSSAQASSSSFANAKSLSFSGTGEHGNNFGQANSGSWSSSGAQNQGEPNSWAPNGVSAFASSSAKSWSGNHPVDVKG